MLNISLEDTQKKLDKALKRNQENQSKTPAPLTKTSVSDLPDDEPISEPEAGEPLEE